MAEYIVNTDVEEARYRAMGADYSVYFNNRVTALLGNPAKERIVRCRDCKLFENSYCKRLPHVVFGVGPDGFCAWGERKD